MQIELNDPLCIATAQNRIQYMSSHIVFVRRYSLGCCGLSCLTDDHWTYWDRNSNDGDVCCMHPNATDSWLVWGASSQGVYTGKHLVCALIARPRYMHHAIGEPPAVVHRTFLLHPKPCQIVQMLLFTCDVFDCGNTVGRRERVSQMGCLGCPRLYLFYLFTVYSRGSQSKGLFLKRPSVVDVRSCLVHPRRETDAARHTREHQRSWAETEHDASPPAGSVLCIVTTTQAHCVRSCLGSSILS